MGGEMGGRGGRGSEYHADKVFWRSISPVASKKKKIFVKCRKSATPRV